MENMTLKRAAELCGGKLSASASEDVELRNIVIDSRAVMRGDLFAAYRGEKTDGHHYIRSAFERGAACCLAEYVPEGVTKPVIVVPDVQRALEKLAKAYREGFSLPLVGITGSVGKTTAKEMISSVLAQRFRTLKTEGNLNNQIGVPMMLSRLNSTYQAAVIELGISGFGEMSLLADIAKPTMAVFTVIGHAHLEFLHDLDGVLRAKTEMLDYLPDDAAVIVNGDDDKLRNLQCRQRKVTFGLTLENDIYAEAVKTEGNSITCKIVCGNRQIPVRIPTFGHHHVYAALAAAAVGLQFDLTDEEIAEGISGFQNVGRRGELFQTPFVTLIDDSYNANPDSVKSGIDSLMQQAGRRHICILGDMLELGGSSGVMHEEVGRYAREKGADLVLCSGTFAEYTARGAEECGQSFESREALIHSIPSLLREGDCVLVKASKSSHYETVAQAVRELAKQKETFCGVTSGENPDEC